MNAPTHITIYPGTPQFLRVIRDSLAQCDLRDEALQAVLRQAEQGNDPDALRAMSYALSLIAKLCDQRAMGIEG